MTIRVRKDAEDGVVLVTVLLLTMIMLIIVAGTMAYAVGSQNISRRDQDWNSALSAAEAGLDDYLFRLNENDQYYLYNATTAPPDGNQAFNTWVSVPDSGATSVTCTASANSNIPCFRYKVDTTNLVSPGRHHHHGDGPLARRDPDHPGDAAPQGLHRLPVLHRLRDEGPGRVRQRRRLHARRSPDPLRDALLRRPRHRRSRGLRRRYGWGHVHRDLVRHRGHGERAAALERRHQDLRRPGLQRQRHHQLEPDVRQQVGRRRRAAAARDRRSAERGTRGTPTR